VRTCIAGYAERAATGLHDGLLHGFQLLMAAAEEAHGEALTSEALRSADTDACASP